MNEAYTSLIPCIFTSSWNRKLCFWLDWTTISLSLILICLISILAFKRNKVGQTSCSVYFQPRFHLKFSIFFCDSSLNCMTWFDLFRCFWLMFNYPSLASNLWQKIDIPGVQFDGYHSSYLYRPSWVVFYLLLDCCVYRPTFDIKRSLGWINLPTTKFQFRASLEICGRFASMKRREILMVELRERWGAYHDRSRYIRSRRRGWD